MIEVRFTGLAAPPGGGNREEHDAACLGPRSHSRLTVQWLYGVVRNLVGTEYRRRAGQHALHERLQVEWEGEEAEFSLELLEIREALLSISEPQRELLQMLYWDELSMAEVAAILECGSGAVRVRALRARRAFASALKQARGSDLTGAR